MVISRKVKSFLLVGVLIALSLLLGLIQNLRVNVVSDNVGNRILDTALAWNYRVYSGGRADWFPYGLSLESVMDDGSNVVYVSGEFVDLDMLRGYLVLEDDVGVKYRFSVYKEFREQVMELNYAEANSRSLSLNWIGNTFEYRGEESKEELVEFVDKLRQARRIVMSWVTTDDIREIIWKRPGEDGLIDLSEYTATIHIVN